MIRALCCLTSFPADTPLLLTFAALGFAAAGITRWDRLSSRLAIYLEVTTKGSNRKKGWGVGIVKVSQADISLLAPS